MRTDAWPLAAIIAVLVAVLASSDALADIFVLENDGRVEGTLTNPKESPRKQYVVKTDDGATVTLDKSQVKDALRRFKAVVETGEIPRSEPAEAGAR